MKKLNENVMAKKNKIVLGFAILLFAHVAILPVLLSRTKGTARMHAADEKERRARIFGLRTQRFTENSNGTNDLIGNLALNRHWTEVLPLAAEQARVIQKLDRLVTEIRYASYTADADYLEGNPPEWEKHLARGKTRNDDTWRHAQRMVALGLLTEPQAGFMIHRFLSGRKFNAVYDGSVQDMLDMTVAQRDRLARIGEEAANRYFQSRPPMKPSSMIDPHEKEARSRKHAAIKREHDAAVKRILTPSQLVVWSRLAADRNAPEAPSNMPALSDVKAAIASLRNLSRTFRLIDAHLGSLGLSAEQTERLSELEEIACQGLLWIHFAGGDGESEPGNDFLRHAEEVALQGILTQRQEDTVRAALTKK